MTKKFKILTVIIITLAITPNLLIKIGEKLDPLSINLNSTYQPPSQKHPLGTDYLGRDLLARIIYATGLSLKMSSITLSVSLILSLTLGSIAGIFYNKIPDKIISWISSLLMTTPLILLISATLSTLEPNPEFTYLTIGLFTWTIPARLVRTETIQLKNSTFITAQKALGFPNYLIMIKIIPLTIYPAVINSLFILPELISIEVALSFLGFGPQPPTPSLGKLILTGTLEANIAWWQAIFPITALVFLITSIYFLSKKLSQLQI